MATSDVASNAPNPIEELLSKWTPVPAAVPAAELVIAVAIAFLDKSQEFWMVSYADVSVSSGMSWSLLLLYLDWRRR